MGLISSSLVGRRYGERSGHTECCHSTQKTSQITSNGIAGAAEGSRRALGLMIINMRDRKREREKSQGNQLGQASCGEQFDMPDRHVTPAYVRLHTLVGMPCRYMHALIFKEPDLEGDYYV